MNQLSVRTTSILDLPPEILEMICQHFRNDFDADIINFSEALIGTRHQEYFTQKFLIPQLKIFTSLDVNLKKLLINEVCFEECQCHDTKLIANFWKDFKPFLRGITVQI